MRPITFLLVLLAALSVPVNAVTCSTDQVPAATLLLPYFEADLATPPSVETDVVVRNAAAKPVIANLVIWSDEGIAVLDFPIVLPAYGSYDFSLDNLVATGEVPESSPGMFASCRSLLPVPRLPSALLQHVQNALTGRGSALLGGKCVGLSLPGRPNIAHGYITVDVVAECTLKFPSDPGYFIQGGHGIATNNNYLFGNSLYSDFTLPLNHAEPLVAIEADPQFGNKSYTFYGRLLSPQWSGADNREPLATNFGAGFAIGGFFAGTELFVWRDPRAVRTPFTCGAPPAALPQTSIAAFGKTDSTPRRLGGAPFGAVAQRVAIGGPTLPIPSSVGDFGWLFLNLGHNKGVPTDSTVTQRRVAQAWVTILTRTAPPPPLYSAGAEAVRLDSACKGKAKPNAILPNP